jgi:HAE1 family hydrophobic/amphiphilic exporter-1
MRFENIEPPHSVLSGQEFGQTVDAISDGLRVAEITDAIIAATRTRIRPIFKSTPTSVFGMLPLVLFPGAGSELYRGLGSVVVGGLTLSAVLTLAITPPLLGLVVPLVEGRGPAGETMPLPERKAAE